MSVGTNRTVRLADIAEVKDLYAEQRSVSKQDGRQVLTFGFERAKGASDVTVYDAAVEELRKLAKENPKVKFTELFSDIEYTKEIGRPSCRASVCQFVYISVVAV